jgi:hypothetical protein
MEDEPVIETCEPEVLISVQNRQTGFSSKLLDSEVKPDEKVADLEKATEKEVLPMYELKRR